VIFIDIHLPKIRHLLVSAIPNIHAHFPTSVTFLMRLLDLCSNAKDATDAINRSLIARQCPFIAQSSQLSPLIDVQTRLHSLYTFDFLYRSNLINGKGDRVGLAGLHTHLHYFEPEYLSHLCDGSRIVSFDQRSRRDHHHLSLSLHRHALVNHILCRFRVLVETDGLFCLG
jgi:hypothetical protein